MKILNTKSLAVTAENLNEAFFNGIGIPKSEKIIIAKWIASRQGGTHSYANMFEPMPLDFSRGFKLFTGEEVTSGAGIGYCLGQDCCRLLAKININDNTVRTALKNAIEGITQRINSYDFSKGFYCCGRCSTVYWRFLAADADKNASLLKAAVKILKSYRIGNGKWQRFPYWHTLLALTEIPPQISGEELKYALPLCEKVAARKNTNKDKYISRRLKIAQKALQSV
ncbi:MAG: hypothetical protein A2Y10_06235 [Planctomycetes bacterium GWF2_41_51]|nr:MAG: hypothetical protein A2Y10_06235 [Planctomycetes bacterium GWF2_41_51]